MRFDNCFCTNSICTPSRAVILSGTYNHVNGVTTLATHMDNRLLTYPKLLQEAGYQTAIFGKWHLGVGPEHCPTGFDDWAVLPGQGLYHEPEFIHKGPDGGTRRGHRGYVTDLITDMSLDWLRNRDESKPFCLMVHHKAPHRHWETDLKHAHLYEDETIPEPDTLQDDYSTRTAAAREAKMRVGVHMNSFDLDHQIPRWMPENELRSWAYQHYIKKYLRTIASVDDNVGRVLDYLDDNDLADDTIVVYTSDQGFYLGDHGWYDKRFMYEQSLRMPFVIRYPRAIDPGSITQDMLVNIDFAPTFLDYCGLDVPDSFQGVSARPVLEGATPGDWQTSMYYRYWMHGDGSHNVYAHYGVRTRQHKLICYYNDPLGQPGAKEPSHPVEWELYDLHADGDELNNLYNDPAHADTVATLKAELARLQAKFGDEPYPGAA